MSPLWQKILGTAISVIAAGLEANGTLHLPPGMVYTASGILLGWLHIPQPKK